MTLLCYPLFRQCTAVIGQISRSEDSITRNKVKERAEAEIGHLGGLDRSVERIIASLTDWGILFHVEEKNIYKIHAKEIQSFSPMLQTWLLGCALNAHPSDAIPFADLIHLPELFPFMFSITIADLRNHEGFEVQRQGGALDMVSRSKVDVER